jgi:zinc finger protein 830
MADVRALLAAERQSRRIKHPLLTYTKTGALICNVCQLNVKSESLWDGHLRSANHKKHARAAEEAASKSLKRRREDDDDEEPTRGDTKAADVDLDRRKIPKSRAASLAEKQAQVSFQDEVEVIPDVPPVPVNTAPGEDRSRGPEIVEGVVEEPMTTQESRPPNPPPETPAVDEDEWAAFERDIAPLAQAAPAAASSVAADKSGAVITAAPISAAQLAEQQAEAKRKQAELSVEEEQEDERGRMEEEFEIMEEMEDRIRRLKKMREKLRAGPSAGAAEALGTTDAARQLPDTPREDPAEADEKKPESEEEDDDSDPDDWYN